MPFDCYAVARISDPASEPVSLAEAKAQCRVEHSDDDAYISALVAAARMRVEDDLGIVLVSHQWRLTADGFPCGGGRIEIPRTPLISVESVAYVDVNGDAQTMDAAGYRVIAAMGVIEPTLNGSWPSTAAVTGAAVVEFTAGYGVAASVPGPIKQAIKLMVGHWYRNRESVVMGTIVAPLPHGVDWLLGPYWPGRY